ncbi:aldehyde dehydrogenase family protein [bacterium]|nr:aldehyde dehydrogenase family protein [bacterium]
MAIPVAVPAADAVACALIEAPVPKTEALKIGPASDPNSEMGPLVIAEHGDGVKSYIDAGKKEGVNRPCAAIADRKQSSSSTAATMPMAGHLRPGWRYRTPLPTTPTWHGRRERTHTWTNGFPRVWRLQGHSSATAPCAE